MKNLFLFLLTIFFTMGPGVPHLHAQTAVPFPFGLSQVSSAEVLQWVQAPRLCKLSGLSRKAASYSQKLDSVAYYEGFNGSRFRSKQTAVWEYDASNRIEQISIFDSLPSGTQTLSYRIEARYGLGDGNDESLTFTRFEGGTPIPDYRIDRTYDSNDRLEEVTVNNLEEDFVEGRGVYGYGNDNDSIEVFAPELRNDSSEPVALIRRTGEESDPSNPGGTQRTTEIESDFNEILLSRRSYIRERAFYNARGNILKQTTGDAPEQGSPLFTTIDEYDYSYEDTPNIKRYLYNPNQEIVISYDTSIAYGSVVPYEITPTSFPAQGYGQDYYDPVNAVKRFSINELNNIDRSVAVFYYQKQTTNIEEKPKALSSVQVYPNPADDQLQVVSKQPVQEYRIIDLQGRVLRKASLNGNTISVSSITEGSYILELQTEGLRRLRKRILIR